MLFSLVSRNIRILSSAPSSCLVRSKSNLLGVVASTTMTNHPHSTVPSFNSRHRFFTTVESESSHSDFAPKKKPINSSDSSDVASIIDQHVKANPVMLYMKGSPSAPQCGFSLRVVQILQKEGIDFSSVNVLDYPSIREGIKEYSNWPTIPQLYIHGEFIGGCDIVTDLHTSGELKELLNQTKE
jgi:monothiol glutaredoxin